MSVLQIVIALTLSWLLAGVVVLALLNVAKWQVHRSSGRPVIADASSPGGIELHSRDAAELDRAVARHPAARTRDQFAAGTR